MLPEGVYHWTAAHPEWEGPVSAYAIDDGVRLILIDPIAVPDDVRALFGVQSGALPEALAVIRGESLEFKGNQDVRLTIDRGLQQAAVDQLKGKHGAVVVLNPQNGDVLALDQRRAAAGLGEGAGQPNKVFQFGNDGGPATVAPPLPMQGPDAVPVTLLVNGARRAVSAMSASKAGMSTIAVVSPASPCA